jgi:Skp family chaperone for outer membrane proteins
MLGMFSLQSNAQKIAFVNETDVLNSIQGYQSAKEYCDSLNKVYSMDIQSQQETIEAKYNALLLGKKLSPNITIEELKEKMSDIEKMKLEILIQENSLLQKYKESKQSEFDKVYQEKVGVIVERVNKVMADYCKQNKIDALFKIDTISPALAFYNEKTDVSSVIINLLKK